MLLMPTAHECLSAQQPPPRENIYSAVLRQAAERRQQLPRHEAAQIERIWAKAESHGDR
jgi:hypothetical protein